MGFENIYEIEISESMINLGCHVKLLTGILSKAIHTYLFFYVDHVVKGTFSAIFSSQDLKSLSRLHCNGEHWSNDKNDVNIASGLAISISCLQSMGFENIYEIEISESMINLDCHVKLLTGILWDHRYIFVSFIMISTMLTWYYC
jgi:hypothetical protein